MKKLFLLVFLMLGGLLNLSATIKLPSIFSNNMILQRNSKVTIWGTADYGETIELTTSWDNNKYLTKSNKQGKWKIIVSTPDAGGPYEVIITGSATIIFENVMIGEVWLCTGQSNMGYKATSGLLNQEKEISAANYPKIRLFKVQRAQSDKPENDCLGQWVECSPETMKNFSSVGYFFGRELHQNLDVPIGLIESTWGGTSIELWTSKETIFNDSIALESAKIATKWPIENVGTMFNAMISPLIPFEIAGNIWYQGESNRYKFDSYKHLMCLMINEWRNLWGKDFPFYYVQIAPFRYNEPFTGALIREQQLKAMSIPNTGMVVTTDVGNPEDVHPENKQVVGHRLALWALAKTYGFSDLVYSGPIFKNMKLLEGQVEVVFDFAENGLMQRGEEIKGFELAGKDKIFYPATAQIKGSKVRIKSSKVKDPIACRFSFDNITEPNLYNIEGLPASPFRTDDWTVDIQPIEINTN